MPNNSSATAAATGEPESAYAWMRLLACVLIGTVGSVGMWSVVVALPAFQADFGVARADASLPYTLAMIGFAAGAVLMGNVADRWGIVVPVKLGALMLAVGFAASAIAEQHLAVRPGASADRLRQLGDLRAADRRHLALVRPPPRHRRRHLRLRQLSGRRHLAADRQLR